MWVEDGRAIYDSLLCVVKVQDNDNLAIGVEYVLPSQEELEGRMVKAWLPWEGVAVMGCHETVCCVK